MRCPCCLPDPQHLGAAPPASRKSRKAADQGVRCSQFVRLCYNLAPTVSSGQVDVHAVLEAAVVGGVDTVAGAAVENVAAGAAVEHVTAVAAAQGVVAVAAEEGVFAAETGERVVAGKADHVVAP